MFIFIKIAPSIVAIYSELANIIDNGIDIGFIDDIDGIHLGCAASRATPRCVSRHPRRVSRHIARRLAPPRAAGVPDVACTGMPCGGRGGAGWPRDTARGRPNEYHHCFLLGGLL